MLMDKQVLVSDQQTIAVAAGNLLCTDAIDLGLAGTVPGGLVGSFIRDMGRGGHPQMEVVVTEQVASAGASTTQFQLVTADDAALSTNLTVINETPAIPKATLVPGYRARLAIPPGITQRYLGVRYVIGTATQTAGKVTAGLVYDIQETFIG